MMKQTNKLLSVLLTVCLIVGLIPWTVLPARAAGSPTVIQMNGETLQIDGAEWTVTDSKLTLPAGSYQLGSDITTTATIEVTGNVTLDLNDHGIRADANYSNNTFSVISVSDDAAFTLKDTAANGTLRYITLGEISDGGDKVHGTEVNTVTPEGVEGTDYLAVTGGYITGGLPYGDGGGVYVTGVSRFTLNGGTFENGSLTGGTANNVHLISSMTVTVTGALTTGASIGVTKNADATVAQGGKLNENDSNYTITAADAAKFTSDNAAYAVVLDNNQAKLVSAYALTVTGGTGSGSYAKDAQVSVSATAPAGEKFKEWTATGIDLIDEQKTTANLTITMPDNAVTLTASFVDATVTGVTLDKTTLSLAPNETATLTVSYQPSGVTDAQKGVTWSSSNASVAAVDENGMVTAKAEGTATITATSKSSGTVKATCTVTVKAASNNNTNNTGRNGGGYSGGDSAPAYTQQLPATQEFDGGKVAISPANAKQGDTVTLKVTPAAGQRLASLAVKRVNGTAPVPVVDKGNGVFEFTMPSVQVAVEAKFEPIGAQPAPGAAEIVLSPQHISVNGASVSLTAYNIGGYNFFGLRELAPYIGYGVAYDEASNTAIIESK